MTTALTAKAFWGTVLPSEPRQDWMADITRLGAEAESRRHLADYKTGSITELEAYNLRALAEYLRVRVVIEVGTFIGLSTTALASTSSVKALYTCDASNDCLPSSGVISTFPKQSSTQMLSQLLMRGVSADLCFFDGALCEQDVSLLTGLCGPDTVFAVHDHNYGPKLRKTGWETVPRKGIGNVRLLRRGWPRHVLVEPLPETTLALMVPEHRL